MLMLRLLGPNFLLCHMQELTQMSGDCVSEILEELEVLQLTPENAVLSETPEPPRKRRANKQRLYSIKSNFKVKFKFNFTKFKLNFTNVKFIYNLHKCKVKDFKIELSTCDETFSDFLLFSDKERKTFTIFQVSLFLFLILVVCCLLFLATDQNLENIHQNL